MYALTFPFLVETICHYLHLFSEQFHSAGASPSLLLNLQRQASVTSTCSQLSGLSSPDSAYTSIVNSRLFLNFKFQSLVTMVTVCVGVFNPYYYMSGLVGKPTIWFPNRSDTNQAVQSQKQARSLKFWS